MRAADLWGAHWSFMTGNPCPRPQSSLQLKCDHDNTTLTVFRTCACGLRLTKETNGPGMESFRSSSWELSTLSVITIALWQKYTVTCINKLRSCYNKCIKLFSGYHRRDSFTQVLIDTGLPSFDTVMYNSACVFSNAWQNCPNVLVQYFCLCNI